MHSIVSLCFATNRSVENIPCQNVVCRTKKSKIPCLVQSFPHSNISYKNMVCLFFFRFTKNSTWIDSHNVFLISLITLKFPLLFRFAN